MYIKWNHNMRVSSFPASKRRSFMTTGLPGTHIESLKKVHTAQLDIGRYLLCNDTAHNFPTKSHLFICWEADLSSAPISLLS